ncbi:Asp23/Gls24 family envelope stress response protein [Lactococcus termiticola]|uniref:Alkaline shock protein n=1 Tax=Lactococcus termiticola TaxID=2169526 RepID=A0A2R5HE85_9LACT|nr:Asp23/Gls24 family envelope stress response protein [Lactococcus termiticola]GBG96329.1 alkaline shock protein [Lactococcus termiticola]
MTENTIQEELGEIVIAPEVLEVIVGITAAKIEGVHTLRNKRFSDSLGKKSEGRGVYISSDENDKVTVDIYVYLTYGVSVPKVALNIQKEVKEAVSQATDVQIDEVNIHVVGVVTEKAEKPSLDELFDEGFFNA